LYSKHHIKTNEDIILK